MKLALQKFGPDDVGDYLALVGDVRVMAMITERAIPPDEARDDYARLLAGNDLAPDLGHFRILEAPSGRFIGLAKLEVASSHASRAELGYMLLPEHWGKGIGGRIASLLVDRARQQPQLHGLLAIIDPANLPSRKILIRHGFVSRELKDFDGLPGEILTLDWSLTGQQPPPRTRPRIDKPN